MSTKISTYIEKDKIEDAIKELGIKISNTYMARELIVIGVLKGAWIFMADLVRSLEISVKCGFIKISSYGYLTKSSGNITLDLGISEDIKGKDVLIVDCISDTGLSLDFVKKYLVMKSPSSIKTCVLIEKEVEKVNGFKVDYVGIKVPDIFFVGYGLDYKNRYRELSNICELIL